MRAIRARVPEDGTIYFIDAEESPGAAAYFALHYLAPRRLVSLGTTRQRSLGWLKRRVPAGVEQVLIVDGDGRPLRLVPVDTLPDWKARRAR